MRAVVITKAGPPEVLQVEERPDPEPGPGQVAIDVRACGVNFADTMARVGLYPDAPNLPAVVGYEVAGTRVDTGERVLAGTHFGGYQSRVVVGEEDIVPLPERLSFEQGAAIPVNYATAWAGLVRYGGLQAGERVLVQAAAGGVGIAAIQLAKRFGAEVYGAASPGKHDAVRAQGAVAVDYGQRGLPKFDLIMDAIGGRSFRTSYNLLNPGGRLIAFGAVGGDERREAQRRHRRPRRGADAALQPDQADERLEVGDRAQHAAAVGARGHAAALDGPARRADGGRHDPAGGGRGGAVRPRARRAPDDRRAPQRREGRPHTVIARRPASASSRPSAAASGAQASAAVTPACSTSTPASQAPTALPAT